MRGGIEGITAHVTVVHREEWTVFHFKLLVASTKGMARASEFITFYLQWCNGHTSTSTCMYVYIDGCFLMLRLIRPAWRETSTDSTGVVVKVTVGSRQPDRTGEKYSHGEQVTRVHECSLQHSSRDDMETRRERPGDISGRVLA